MHLTSKSAIMAPIPPGTRSIAPKYYRPERGTFKAALIGRRHALEWLARRRAAGKLTPRPLPWT